MKRKMKNALIMMAGAMILLLPVGAGAGLVGTGILTESAFSPSQAMTFPTYGPATVLTDYKGNYTINGNNFSGEIYCVEDALSPPVSPSQIYGYWTIDDSLPTNVAPDRYKQATWLANWGVSTGKKSVAQLAIWEVVLETASGYDLSAGNLTAASTVLAAEAQSLLSGAFQTALGNDTWDDYANLWLLAVNPTTETPIDPVKNYQNYLVPNPVPIPSAVFLLGAGFVGLVGIRRKFKQ